MGFESLQGYTPQKVSDGFDIIKAKGLECNVNYARIEDYKGPKAELEGTKVFRYELEVFGGTTEFLGRKFWASFNLSDDKKLKKLADLMFTLLAMTFTDEDSLGKCAEAFVSKTVNVRAWGWTPDDASEPIQQHQIKGVLNGTTKATAKPAF